MDLSSFRLLLTPLGQQALNEAAAFAPQESSFLQSYTLLSRKYPAGLCRAALETAILRKEAEIKFPLANGMYFTRQALEQASSSVISKHRAQRFRGYDRVLDLGCSIGSDTLAIAVETAVLGVDIDPLRLAMAKQNVQLLDCSQQVEFLQADVSTSLPFRRGKNRAIFFDPGRRSEGRRLHSVHSYQPPLNVIDQWVGLVPAVGVKISPGVDLEEVYAYRSEIEFISVRGELKEAVLWFGPLQTAQCRATLLPGGFTLSGECLSKTAKIEKTADISDPRAYLFEPDPAILRAGLVRQLGSQINAAQLDPDIAYLTGDAPVPTPFAHIFRVEEWLPFHLKNLRSLLRQKGIESATVKKRGSPIPPEKLLHDLGVKPGPGNTPGECIIVLTHLRGKPIAVLCSPFNEDFSLHGLR